MSTQCFSVGLILKKPFYFLSGRRFLKKIPGIVFSMMSKLYSIRKTDFLDIPINKVYLSNIQSICSEINLIQNKKTHKKLLNYDICTVLDHI